MEFLPLGKVTEDVIHFIFSGAPKLIHNSSSEINKVLVNRSSSIFPSEL